MKTVLVTGGSSGIGEGITRMLAKEGYRVFFTYNGGKDRAKTIEEETGALAVKLDLNDRESMKRAVDMIGGVDVLVNNAGVSEFRMFTDVTEEQYDFLMGVNLKGAYMLTQLAVPNMVSKKWGRIVNVSSMWGVSGASCEVTYSTSKAGLIGFTKALAKELGLSGITVNCVAPGFILTRMSENIDESIKAQFIDETPMNRLGKPEDIANAVRFFISEDSSFVTGQTIVVDGGYIL